MPKWEYAILFERNDEEVVLSKPMPLKKQSDKKIAAALVDKTWSEVFKYMGSQGWEAFAVLPGPGGDDENRYAYFKRPAPEPKKPTKKAKKKKWQPHP